MGQQIEILVPERFRGTHPDHRFCFFHEPRARSMGIPSEKCAAMDSGSSLGVGIRGMRERLRQLGGTLEVYSNEEGTSVVARLPIANAPLIAA